MIAFLVGTTDEKMSIKYCRNIYFFLIFILFFPGIIQAEDKNMKSIWDPFSRWFEWKKTTNLTGDQRDVIIFFEKAGEIKKNVKKIVTSFNPPLENIELIQKYIMELKNLCCPKICKDYQNSLIKELTIYLEYEEARRAGIPDEEIQKIQLRALDVDGVEFVAFFQTLKVAGLYNNFNEEIERFKN